jgi:hypothetical protein
VEEKEHVFAGEGVPRVQRFDPRRRGREDFFVARSVLRRRVGEIAQDRKLEIGIAIGEKLHFEVLERFLHSVHARQKRGHYDRRHVFFGNTIVAQLELRHETRRH